MIDGQTLSTRTIATGLRQNHLQPLIIGERSQLHLTALQAFEQATANHEMPGVESFGLGFHRGVGHCQIRVGPVQAFADGCDLHFREVYRVALDVTPIKLLPD